jgi:peptidoglycan hydrolase-like protein with peptidoglycan-binding domain
MNVEYKMRRHFRCPLDVPLIDVQQALKAKGYYTGPVDGVWNRETWAAIVEFKRANGLKPDGVVTVA